MHCKDWSSRVRNRRHEPDAAHPAFEVWRWHFLRVDRTICGTIRVSRRLNLILCVQSVAAIACCLVEKVAPGKHAFRSKMSVSSMGDRL
jgi:hypothetical protein